MCNECFLYSWAGSDLELFSRNYLPDIYILKDCVQLSGITYRIAENLVLGDAGIVDKINLKTIRLVNNNEELEALIKKKENP